ncbi:MAG: diguanylate cyclase [Candidatus Omnitrophica bacterium]|nr:diguanylate cyclase [Candidatus Omnitrophota bacterium]
MLLGINALLLHTPLLRPMDHAILNLFFKFRPSIATDPSIVYVEIAEDGLKEIGRWPWPRHYHAVMAHLLSSWGARAVLFDILFSERGTPFDDGSFAEALKISEKVYLPIVLEPRGSNSVWIHSLPEFEQHAKTGHINAVVDPDGILRRIRPYLGNGEESHPHLALRIAYDLLGQEVPPPERLPLPLESDGTLLVNWAGRWTQTFRHFSYLDLLRSYEAVSRGEKPLVSPDDIRGKICLIGLTATGHTDTKATPMEPVYPALGVHANVINSILTGQLIRPASKLLNLLCILAAGLTTTLLFVRLQPVVATVAGLVLATAWPLIAFTLFCIHSLWISAAHPVAAIFSIGLALTAYTEMTTEKERRRLSFLATRDGLTDLYVIRHFRSLLNQKVVEAAKEADPLSVLMVDLDHFKQINDVYGHAAGDKVLKETAAVLQTCLRESDIAGRYGGEEIIVMLPKTLTPAAALVAERIRKGIERYDFLWEGKRIPVTVSIGVASLNRGETVPDPMVRRADEALYQAKNGGRNRVAAARII